jgi:hypothetical protein
MADVANLYEVHAQYVTFKAGAGIAYSETEKNGSAHVGKFVMHSADGEVDLVTNGLEICGKLIKVEPDNFCTVQDEGYADGPSDGVITYTNAANGLVGGTTAGTAKAATAVPAAGAVRGAKAVKSDGAGRVIVKFIA